MRSEPRDTISSPLSKTHLRLARPVVAQHRIARLAARAFGPEALRPGRTVLMLLASTTVLAILVLGLLVFVGRRPDPRVAASEHRLRTGATW